MSLEKQLPAALRQHMNRDEEIVSISAWTGTTGNETLDGALPRAASYDKQRSKFVATIQNAQIQFLIKEHQDRNKGTKLWDHFDPETCTWQQVFDSAMQAEAEYEGKASGNHIRRIFRGESLARNINPLLEALPENDGLGFLKGGLIIVFNAIKRRSQACEKILESLRAIPDVIVDAQHKRKRYPQDITLFTRTNELYNALFDAVPLLIEILNRSSDEAVYKKLGRSVFGDEVARVEDILRPVVAAKRALEQLVAHLATERDDEDSKHIRAAHVELGVLRQNELNHHVETITEVQYTSQTSGRIENKLDKALTDLELVHAENAEFRKRVLQVLNSFYVIQSESYRTQAFCKDQERNVLLEGTTMTAIQLPRDGGSYDMQQLSPSAAYHEQDLDLSDVLAALCSDEEIKSHAQDLYLTLRKHHSFSDKDLAQPAYLTSMARFRQWQSGSTSDLVLVDGHSGGGGRTTPMSVFCATLIQSLLDLDAESSTSATSPVVLYFFCGLHKDPNGCLPGPGGLMRSLIAQLILAWPEESRKDLQSIKQLPVIGQTSESIDHDNRILCEVFEELLRHFPAGLVVHCIIDGISHFETSLGGWSTDMRTIASTMEGCTTKLRGASSNSSRVKILLASAGKSTVMKDEIPRDGQVSLRAGNFLGQPLSPRSLTRTISRQTSSEEALVSTRAEGSRGSSRQS